MKVFVDAKITGIHDPGLRRRGYIGYYVEDTGAHKEKPTTAQETDDAEIEAILFAIEELSSIAGSITIVCDHQSVVSEATRPSARRPSEFLTKLRKTLESKGSQIRLEALQSNLAHKTVTEYVNREPHDDNSIIDVKKL